MFSQDENDLLKKEKILQIKAKLVLAYCYRFGIHIDEPKTAMDKIDPYATMELFQEAAQLGSTRACFELGMIFMFGWPPFIKQDLIKAKYYFQNILVEERFESHCDAVIAQKLFSGFLLYNDELKKLEQFKVVTEIFLKQISYEESKIEYDKNILRSLRPLSIAIVGAILAVICPELSLPWLGWKWLFEDLGLPILDDVERFMSYVPHALILYFVIILESGGAIAIVHDIINRLRQHRLPQEKYVQHVHATEYLASGSGVIFGNLLVHYSELPLVKKIIVGALGSSIFGMLFSRVKAMGYLADPVGVEHMKQQEFDLFKSYHQKYHTVVEKNKNKQITKITLEAVAHKLASLTTNKIKVPDLLQLSLYAVRHYLHDGVILKDDFKKLPDNIRSKFGFST